MKTVRDVILGAVDLLETKGRAQKVYQTDDGCLCPVAAIVLSAGGYLKFNDPEDEAEGLPPDDYGAPTPEALELIKETIVFVGAEVPPTQGDPAFSLVEWNDIDGRPDEEVFALMRGAASELIP